MKEDSGLRNQKRAQDSFDFFLMSDQGMESPYHFFHIRKTIAWEFSMAQVLPFYSGEDMCHR